MLRNLLETIKRETQPIAGHDDPEAIEDCWRSAFEELEAIEHRLAADGSKREPEPCPIHGFEYTGLCAMCKLAAAKA